MEIPTEEAMPYVADDFDTIRARMKELRQEEARQAAAADASRPQAGGQPMAQSSGVPAGRTTASHGVDLDGRKRHQTSG